MSLDWRNFRALGEHPTRPLDVPGTGSAPDRERLVPHHNRPAPRGVFQPIDYGL
jgi:hypothetical protein